MFLQKKHRKTVVAIPARDEAERIVGCLEALDNQDGVRLNDIVLLVNNTSDGTAALARSVPLSAATRLHVIEQDMRGAQANAGFARRLAMQATLPLVGDGGILLTSDADGLVDTDWLAANLAAIDAGADAVAGWVDLHPLEWGAIPEALHEDDARECAYDALCDELHGLLDPDTADPLPRHTQHSGASIAVTAEAFRRCGGVPPVALGEDRALIAALRRIDARVRHSPAVHVTVSGRTVGRAAGGMADTIRRRLTKPDDYIDDRLEPAAHCARRAVARHVLRRMYLGECSGIGDLATVLGLEEKMLRHIMSKPHFGLAWERVEAKAPLRLRRPVAAADLAAETFDAQAILGEVRRYRPGSLTLRGLEGLVPFEIEAPEGI